MTDDMDDDNMFEGKLSNSMPEIAKTRLPFHQLAKKTWEVNYLFGFSLVFGDDYEIIISL